MSVELILGLLFVILLIIMFAMLWAEHCYWVKCSKEPKYWLG